MIQLPPCSVPEGPIEEPVPKPAESPVFSRRAFVAGASALVAAIASGSIASIDQAAAERSDGVLAVITPWNALRLPQAAAQLPASRHVAVIQDKGVFHNLSCYRKAGSQLSHYAR